MTARSYLFVPGNAPDKMAKAAAGDADAIILDLEDSVAEAGKDDALRLTSDFLSVPANEGRSARFWVRVNATDTARAMREICSLPLARLAGIVVPKLSSLDHLSRFAFALDALEIRDGLEPGGVGVIGIVTETAASLLAGSDLGRGHPRLRGYTWGMEDLSADLGRAPMPGGGAASQAIAAHAQMFCLLAAKAAGIAAIDAIDPDFRDTVNLERTTRQAAELGFSGRMAIHPAQIAPIHAGFTPDEAVLAWARSVVALADSNPNASAFQLDGRMVDRPHVKIAHKIVAASGV